jgi:membrane associated rhomboid family serine protease
VGLVIEWRRADSGLRVLEWDEFETLARRGEIDGGDLVRYSPITADAWVRADSLEVFLEMRDGERARFEKRFTFRRMPWVSLTVAALLIAVFAWQLRTAPGLTGADLVAQGAKSWPHQVELGQWWRLLSASVLHAGWMHLVPNIVYIAYVGWSVESLLGRASTIVVLVASALGAMALSTIATPMPTVGASGLTFGLFGAATSLGWRFGAWLPAGARRRFGWAVFPFVVYFLIFGALWSEWVDNFCHIGGFGAGSLVALLLPSSLVEPPDRLRGALRVFAAVLLALAVSVGLPQAARAGLLPAPPLAGQPTVLDEAGAALRVPGGWRKAVDEPLTFVSGTGGGRLVLRGWVEPERADQRLHPAVRLQRDLQDAGGIIAAPRGARIGPPSGCTAVAVDAVLQGHLLAVGRLDCRRGLYGLAIDFVHPVDAWDAYAPLRSKVARSLTLVEPAALREARARGPGAAAMLRRGVEEARFGRWDDAEAAFRAAEAELPAEVATWRAWALSLRGETGPR